MKPVGWGMACLFLSVGGIVIGLDQEHPQKIAVTKADASGRLADPKGLERVKLNVLCV
jgi:hypothetical protein